MENMDYEMNYLIIVMLEFLIQYIIHSDSDILLSFLIASLKINFTLKTVIYLLSNFIYI